MPSPLRRFPFYPGRKPEQFADRLGSTVELRLLVRLEQGQNAHLIADDFWEAGGGGAPATLPAGNQAATVTAPAGAVSTLAGLAAGAQTSTVTAPSALTATLIGLAAGGQTATLTAGAADATYVLPAGGQTVTLAAPDAAQSMLTALLAGAAQVAAVAAAAVIPGATTVWNRVSGRISVRGRRYRWLPTRILRNRSRR